MPKHSSIWIFIMHRAALDVYKRQEMDTIPISQQMEASGIAVKQYAEDYADYTLFESSDALYGDLITPRNQDDAYAAMGGEEGMKNMRKSHLTLMGVSAYNKQMELQGREPVVDVYKRQYQPWPFVKTKFQKVTFLSFIPILIIQIFRLCHVVPFKC